MSKVTECFNKIGFFLIAAFYCMGFAVYYLLPRLWKFIKFCLEIIGTIFVMMIEAFFETMKSILDW